MRTAEFISVSIPKYKRRNPSMPRAPAIRLRRGRASSTRSKRIGNVDVGMAPPSVKTMTSFRKLAGVTDQLTGVDESAVAEPRRTGRGDNAASRPTHGPVIRFIEGLDGRHLYIVAARSRRMRSMLNGSPRRAHGLLREPATCKALDVKN